MNSMENHIYKRHAGMSFLLSISLLLIFVYEGFAKYERYFFNTDPSSIFRYIFLGLCAFYCILLLNNKTSASIVTLSAIIVLWFLAGIATNENAEHESVFVLMKYMSGLLIFTACALARDKRIIANTFFFVFICNCIIAWVSFYLESDWLRTYGHIRDPLGAWVDLRFGYNGLILEQNVSTYFYIAGVFSTYWQTKYNGKSNLYWLITLPSIFIVGTKSVFIIFLMLPLFYIFRDGYKKTAVFLLTTIIALLIMINADVLDYDMANNIFSFRPYNFVQRLSPLLDGYKVNDLLFGFQIADYKKYLTEFELVDLMSFMGIICASLYLLGFYIVVINTLPVNKGRDSAFNFLFTCFITAVMSGHLFYDPISVIYVSCAYCGAFACERNQAA